MRHHKRRKSDETIRRMTLEEFEKRVEETIYVSRPALGVIRYREVHSGLRSTPLHFISLSNQLGFAWINPD